MNKRIFIDYDNTLVDSTKAELNTLKFLGIDEEIYFNLNQNSTETPQMFVRTVYEHDFFWKTLLPFPGVLETLKKLKDKDYEIIIQSFGSTGNLKNKIVHIERFFDGLYDDVVLLNSKAKIHNKHLINMEGSIMVDDVEENLFHSNAERKILVGYSQTHEWIRNFNEILDLL